jgi:4-azaleucine resistance transporter AzlC
MADKNPYLGRAITIGVAVGFFAASFGVLATGNGLTVLQTCAMSILVFTGASQFAAVGVVASGGSPVTAVASGLLLGIRNAAYGLAMAPRFPRRFLPRALCTHLLIDESTALALTAPEEEKLQAFLSGGVSVFIFWNTGTLLGALAGSSIADPLAFGLDAAFPASLLALMAPRLRRPEGRRVALLGAAIALVLTPFLPAGLPIIFAALAIVPELLRKEEVDDL